MCILPWWPPNDHEVIYDLRFELSDLNYLHIHVHIAYMLWALLVASEANTSSKQPQRSNLTSDLEIVAQIAYATMFVWAV